LRIAIHDEDVSPEGRREKMAGGDGVRVGSEISSGSMLREKSSSKFQSIVWGLTAGDSTREGVENREDVGEMLMSNGWMLGEDGIANESPIFFSVVGEPRRVGVEAREDDGDEFIVDGGVGRKEFRGEVSQRWCTGGRKVGYMSGGRCGKIVVLRLMCRCGQREPNLSVAPLSLATD
jgi:hypothetical protein